MQDTRLEVARLLRAASVAALHYLINGDASAELARREEAEFHLGDDPIEADLEAQRHFEEAARDQPAYAELGVVGIIGEEKLEEAPPHKVGERLIVVDPLDGSRPWSIARTGFCVAALALRALDGERWAVEGAIIAMPTEAFTLLGTDHLLHGPLSGDPQTDLVVTSVVPETEVHHRTIAAVAMKPDDRAILEPIVMRLPDWGVLTLGGNPIVPYVVTGRLTAAITLKPSSTWDSVGVLMASATDAMIGDHEGNRLSGPDFLELFAQVLVTHDDCQPIPPLIVAKSDDAYRAIIAAL